MSAAVQIMTTAPSRQEAQRLADLLVERRLAACVQVVGPIHSTYHWQGSIERSEEWLCLAKSQAADFPRVEQTIRAAHSYETPEIVALPIVAASEQYLAWLTAETTPAAGANR